MASYSRSFTSDNRIVMWTPAKTNSAVFQNTNDAALSAILGIRMLQGNNTMGNTANLLISANSCFVIKQKRRAGTPGKILL